MIPLFAVVLGRSHPPVLRCVFSVTACVWWKNGTANDESLNPHEIGFSKQENIPFYREFQCHACPVPARIPRAWITSRNCKATKHVNDCKRICRQSECVKPVILPILNVFGLPKKITAQRQSPPPVLGEAISDIISDDAFWDLLLILVKYGPCFCTLKSHSQLSQMPQPLDTAGPAEKHHGSACHDDGSVHHATLGSFLWPHNWFKRNPPHKVRKIKLHFCHLWVNHLDSMTWIAHPSLEAAWRLFFKEVSLLDHEFANKSV